MRTNANKGNTAQTAESRRRALREAVARDEEAAKKRAANSNQPWRFFQAKGAETEVIILDKELEEAFWRNEHNLEIAGKWGNYEPCIADSGPCPHCKAGSSPYLVVLLTVLVIQQYTNKKTGKVTEYSKRLLPIKRSQFVAFEKIEKVALKKYGTLRGVSILLARSTEETSFSTGMPVPNDDGEVINDFLTEKQLVEEFGNAVELARDGKTVLKAKNEDLVVYDYHKYFPEPDADAIREEYDLDVPGSNRANAKTAQPEGGRSRRAASTEDEAPATTGRRTRAVRVEVVDDVHDDDIDVQPVNQPVGGRRSRTSAPSAPAEEEAEEPKPTGRRRASSKPIVIDHDDDEPDFRD